VRRELLCIGLACIQLSCMPNPCRNEVIRELPSPNGHIKAIVFQRDCGATTGFSTQISLLAAGEKLSEGAGNVLILTDDRGAVPLTSTNTVELGVEWTGNEAVSVTLPSAARVLQRAEQVGAIRVRYIVR